MIFLKPNSPNIAIFRLSNVLGNYDANYLFEVRDVSDRQVLLFTGDNTSTYKSRYDRFIFDVVENKSLEDLNDSKFYLPQGQYRINVYQLTGGTYYDSMYYVNNGYYEGLSLSATTGLVIETDQFKIALDEIGDYSTTKNYL